MSRMKLTKEEYYFFAEHAPKDFDLSVLKLVPLKSNSEIVSIDREAFIELAGITDHTLSAPSLAQVKPQIPTPSLRVELLAALLFTVILTLVFTLF